MSSRESLVAGIYPEFSSSISGISNDSMNSNSPTPNETNGSVSDKALNGEKASSVGFLARLKRLPFPKSRKGKGFLAVFIIILIFLINALVVGLIFNSLNETKLKPVVSTIQVHPLGNLKKQGLSLTVNMSIYNPIPLSYSLKVLEIAVRLDEVSLAIIKPPDEYISLSGYSTSISSLNLTSFFNLNSLRQKILASRRNEWIDDLEVKVKVELYTMAFWFPVSFTSEFNRKMSPKSDSNSNGNSSSLIGFELHNVSVVAGEDSVTSDMTVRVDSFEDQPKVYWEIDREFTASISTSAGDVIDVIIHPHKIRENSNLLSVSCSAKNNNSVGLKQWLESFNNDQDLDLYVKLTTDNHALSPWVNQVESFKWTMTEYHRSIVPRYWDFPQIEPVADVYNITWKSLTSKGPSLLSFDFHISLNIWKMFKKLPNFNVNGLLPKLGLVGNVGSVHHSSGVALKMDISADEGSRFDFQQEIPFSFNCIVDVIDAERLFAWLQNEQEYELSLRGSEEGHLLNFILSFFAYRMPTHLVPSFVYNGYNRTLEMLSKVETLGKEVVTVTSDAKHFSIAANLESLIIVNNQSSKMVVTKAESDTLIANPELLSFGKIIVKAKSINISLDSFEIPVSVDAKLNNGSVQVLFPSQSSAPTDFLIDIGGFNPSFSLKWNVDNPILSPRNILDALSGSRSSEDNKNSSVFNISSAGKICFQEISKVVESTVHSKTSKKFVTAEYGFESLFATVQKYLRATIFPIHADRPVKVHNLIANLDLAVLKELGKEGFWEEMTEVVKVPEFTKTSVQQMLRSAGNLFKPAFTLWAIIISKLFKMEESVKQKMGHFGKQKPMSFFIPFLEAIVKETHEIIGQYNLSSMIKSSIFDDADAVNLDELPPTYAPVFQHFFENYFDKVGYHIKVDVLASFFDLNNSHSEEQTLSHMIHHSGPFMQKTFQLFAENIQNEKLKSQLMSLKNEIHPMRSDELEAQIEIAFGSMENFNKTFPHFRFKSVKAASVGQGHLAQMASDNGSLVDVFVKIQRPNLREKLDEEIKLLLESAQKYGLGGMMEAYSEGYREEIDFAKEYENGLEAMKIFKVNQGPIRTVKYLRKMEGPSTDANKTGDVIFVVMERVNGVAVSSVPDVENKALGCSIQSRLVDLLEGWFMKGMFGKGFFHGDPHGGNIMVEYDSERPSVETTNLTMIDMGNAHFVGNDFAKVFLLVGLGIQFRRSDLVLSGLGFEPITENELAILEAKHDPTDNCNGAIMDEWCTYNEWMSLNGSLSALFQSAAFLNQSIEDQFDSAVKKIGDHGKIPIPPKAIDFFRAKTHLEKLIKSHRKRFSLTSEHCPPVDFSLLYFEWGAGFNTLWKLGLDGLAKAGHGNLAKLAIKDLYRTFEKKGLWASFGVALSLAIPRTALSVVLPRYRTPY